jgi:hypothetical protein
MNLTAWRALVLATLFIMVNCSTSRKQSRALNKAEKAKLEYRQQIAKALELGADVDTTSRIQTHDTVRIAPTVVIGEQSARIDTVKIYEACTEVIQTGTRRASVAELQRAACPPIAIDSSFTAFAEYLGTKYPFTLTVAIQGTPGALSWRLLIGSLSIPTTTTDTAVTISPEIPKFRLKWWQWVLAIGGGALAFIIGFIVGRLLPK